MGLSSEVSSASDQPALEPPSATYDRALLDAISEAPLFSDAHRIFHGRGGSFPGCEHLTLDYFPPVWVLTSFKEVSKEELDRWHNALAIRWKHLSKDGAPLTWVYQLRATSSGVAPNVTTSLMSGQVPDPHFVSERGNRYVVHVLRAQNHGIFLDMATGRAWLEQHARGQQVLNLFAYTCAFSVAALKGGASHVVNVDMSKGALKIGEQNHRLNNFTNSSARFLNYNILKSWGRISKFGPYGLIVADPPSYQKGSFVAKRQYLTLVRRLPALLVPGGYALLCLGAPELDSHFLRDQVAEGAPELQLVGRLDNPSSFPSIWPERSLKVFIYQLPL